MSVSTANNSQVQLTEEAKEVIKNLVTIVSEQRNKHIYYLKGCVSCGTKKNF